MAMTIPLSSVRTMQFLSLLSSLEAIDCALVKLGLRGWEDLRTQLISSLSSSAFCWLSLVHADSMAVMYSKLGGCLGETAKLGPLARTEPCTCVKGLLDKLMTHLGLGPSTGELWGLLALMLYGGLLPPLGVALFAWEVAFPPWEAWEALSLAECMLPLENDLPELLPPWVMLLLTGGELLLPEN